GVGRRAGGAASRAHDADRGPAASQFTRPGSNRRLVAATRALAAAERTPLHRRYLGASGMSVRFPVFHWLSPCSPPSRLCSQSLGVFSGASHCLVRLVGSAGTIGFTACRSF